MATYKSDLVTNATANPPEANEVALSGARVRSCIGYFTHTTTSATDVLLLARIPSNARVLSVKAACSAGTGAGDFGVYDTAGAILNGDAFASASSCDAWEEQRFEAAADSTTGEKLWELAGQSSDPGDMLDIACTVTTATGTTMAFQILYVVD